MRPDSSTLAGVIGKATPGARRLSTSLSTWGPFPRPALPGVSSTTNPSATPPAQSAPRGGLVDACTSPTGIPVLLRLPSCRHAGANTPAGTARCIVRLPSRAAIGLPLLPGGSAPALTVSRPAQRSLKFQPACSLSCSTQPFDTGVLQYMSLPPCTAPVATNRNENCCVGFAPTRKTRLSTAHRKSPSDPAWVQIYPTFASQAPARRTGKYWNAAAKPPPHFATCSGTRKTSSRTKALDPSAASRSIKTPSAEPAVLGLRKAI